MAKAADPIKELQRRLTRLTRLDGTLVRTADGPVLLPTVAVLDPFALLAACRHGPPRLAALTPALRCDGEARPLTPTLLARAHHDLRALALLPWLAIVRAAPRQFRSFGPLDERWLAARGARIDALARALRPAPEPADDPPQDPLLALIRDLHGPDAAAACSDWLARSAGLGNRRRREAERRFAGLVRRLRDRHAAPGEPPAIATMLDAAADELRRLTRRPGRAAARRLASILHHVLAWPHAPTGHSPAAQPVSEDSSPAALPQPHPRLAPVPRDISMPALAARVQELGAELVHTLGTTRSPAQASALRQVLGAYALAFPIDPQSAPPPPLDPGELELAESRLRAAPPLQLPLARALWLLRLPVSPAVCAKLAPWLADGLAPALVEQVIALGWHDRLAELNGDATLAAAYADWLVRIVPHYRRLGVEVNTRPQHFARLHQTHRGGLALLAHCLIEHHAPDERSADAQLARLRATLDLFTARPQRAEALLADLSHAPAGAARRHFPEFAAWLGDDTLLARFCHLCVLADEPLALSSTLRRDFDRHGRLLRQRDHLAALPDKAPALSARLAHLEAELARDLAVDRGWTLRRLGERCEALQVRAFARKLDQLVRELLTEAIGVAPPDLTPAWRDALRFYLGASDRNHELLRELLRFAASNPRQPIAPTLPRNHAWLARAASHLRCDAWLAPQLRSLDLGGARYTLCIEQDPLEVLRMGIPFDTCLALATGFNADSTVLNAVDINKRVLYLRDARGSVVARKLIAISSDFGLLGYRLYCARGAADRPEIAAAFHALCSALASACNLPLVDDGAPETLHPGFWYDDGPEPWTDQDTASLDLEPYFHALGRPAPPRIAAWGRTRVRAWQAAANNDLPAALALLPDLRCNAATAGVHAMISAALGPRELARRARRDPQLARVHVALQLQAGPVAALRAAAGVPFDSQLWNDLADLLDHALPSAELARAVLAAAQHERRHSPDLDDHGLAHRSTRIGESLACLPVAELLHTCDELATLWDWVVAESPQCGACRDSGQRELHRALLTAHARQPDPDAVVAALRGRHGRLAQDAALALAARVSLSPRPCPLGHGLGASWLTRLSQRPLPAPQAHRALRELLRTRPALAEHPDMFAALIRQAGPLARHQDLPRPLTPPFAALGELLLHLPDLATLLAPWQDPGVPPGRWKPDRWELHFHRKVATPWRRHLLRAAHDDPAARLWLARLADPEALARLPGRSHLALARDLHAQLALRERPADVPCDMSLLTAAASRLADSEDPHAIDLALLREAARALEAPQDPAALLPALTLLAAADLPADAWTDAAKRLLSTTAPPDPALLPALTLLIEHAPQHALHAPQIARLAAIPALHAPLLDHLERGLNTHGLAVHALYSQLERAPGADPTRAAFLAAWIARAGSDAADIDTALASDDDARLAACLPAWMHTTPRMWLELYRRLHDLTFQSRFLDALLALPPERAHDLAQLRALVTSEWPHPHDDDQRTAQQWLLAALPAPDTPT